MYFSIDKYNNTLDFLLSWNPQWTIPLSGTSTMHTSKWDAMVITLYLTSHLLTNKENITKVFRILPNVMQVRKTNCESLLPSQRFHLNT